MKKLDDHVDSIANSLALIGKELQNITNQMGGFITDQAKEIVKSASGKSSATEKSGEKKTKPSRTRKTSKTRSVKKKTTVKKKGKSSTVADQVLKAVKKCGDGATIARLTKMTKLESRQIRNSLYKLNKDGLIEPISRGVYVPIKPKKQ